MSVRTTAEENLDDADRNAQAGLEHLNRILVERCWGHDEYTEEYTDGLIECVQLFHHIRRLLNRR